MRLPPAELLRDEPPPDGLLLVVRGGTTTLSDAHLANQVDCWERHRFFGVSVFGAPDDDLVALSNDVRAIRVRPVIRVTRCAELRLAGFEVMPTFPNPRHFSVVLPDGTPATFESLRDCFGDSVANPGHVAEA